jgi:hypothetical protein
MYVVPEERSAGRPNSLGIEFQRIGVSYPDRKNETNHLSNVRSHNDFMADEAVFTAAQFNEEKQLK